MRNLAVKIVEPHKVELVELPMPKPGKGEVLLKVLYSGVCGSDFKVYLGKMNNVVYPKIAGHEFSAEILEVNDDQSDLKPGMIVTATPYYGCGTCYCCRMGYFNCCQNNKCMGVGCDGAFREYVVVPTSKICAGKGINARTLALIEPFANSLHLVKRIDAKKGDKVLIFGAGPIGTFAMIAAKQRGAEVHMVDTVDARLEYAKKMGADGTFNASKGKIADYVEQQTGDVGFSITVEAVGAGSVYLDCINAVSYRGKVCIIGMTTVPYEYNHSQISYKECHVIGSRNSEREDFLDLIDLISSGKIDAKFVEQMATAEYNFEDAVEMYKELETTYTQNMKVLVKFAK